MKKPPEDLSHVLPELLIPRLRGVVRMRLHEINPDKFQPDWLVDQMAEVLADGGCMIVWNRDE